MLLFLPILILGASFLFLVASNLFQRDFRSSWLVTVTGSGMAFVSLIFLRLRIPLSSSLSAWWAGEGLVSSNSFSLDEISWPVTFIVCGLLLAVFLTEVDRAIIAPWLRWAANLMLAVASLLAVFSGDLLTLVFFWILVDALTALVRYRFIERAEEQRDALTFLPVNIAASFVLMAAWFLSGYSGQFSSIMVLISAALRLGVFSSPRVADLVWSLATCWRVLPLASVFVLLARPWSLQGLGQIAVLLVLLLPVFSAAYQLHQQKNAEQSTPSFERGFAVMAIAAAAIGQPLIALGFGLVALVSSSVLKLAQYAPRWRWLLVAASVALFAIQPFLSVSADGNSPILFFVFLIFEAALLSGWARGALNAESYGSTGEPWMRMISTAGLITVPIIYPLLSAGLAPNSSVAIEVGWLQAIIVIVLTALFFILGQPALNRLVVSARLIAPVESMVSMRWIESALDALFSALRWILRMMSRVLEGRAGVLWALLLIVLLLSLASQFARGG